MLKAEFVWELLAWVSMPILALLGVLLVARRFYREFPLFTLYVVLAFSVGIVRYVVFTRFSPPAYFRVYWYSDFTLVLATFLAIYETFLRRLFPAFYKVRFYRELFPLVASVLALLAFLTAANSFDQRAAFFITSRVFDFVRSAVIAFFVLLILVMGRRFTGQDFSIAAGFGLQAAAALVNAAVRTRTNYRQTVLDHVETAAFDIACLIWLLSFWKRSVPADNAKDLNPELLTQAQSWEKILKRWLMAKKRLF